MEIPGTKQYYKYKGETYYTATELAKAIGCPGVTVRPYIDRRYSPSMDVIRVCYRTDDTYEKRLEWQQKYQKKKKAKKAQC